MTHIDRFIDQGNDEKNYACKWFHIGREQGYYTDSDYEKSFEECWKEDTQKIEYLKTTDKPPTKPLIYTNQDKDDLR